MRRTKNKTQFINAPTTHQLRRAIRHGHKVLRAQNKYALDRLIFGYYYAKKLNLEEGN
jgi:hypothetical protein